MESKTEHEFATADLAMLGDEIGTGKLDTVKATKVGQFYK